MGPDARVPQRTRRWRGATAEGVSERAEMSADQCANLQQRREGVYTTFLKKPLNRKVEAHAGE